MITLSYPLFFIYKITNFRGGLMTWHKYLKKGGRLQRGHLQNLTKKHNESTKKLSNALKYMLCSPLLNSKGNKKT